MLFRSIRGIVLIYIEKMASLKIGLAIAYPLKP